MKSKDVGRSGTDIYIAATHYPILQEHMSLRLFVLLILYVWLERCDTLLTETQTQINIKKKKKKKKKITHT